MDSISPVFALLVWWLNIFGLDNSSLWPDHGIMECQGDAEVEKGRTDYEM